MHLLKNPKIQIAVLTMLFIYSIELLAEGSDFDLNRYYWFPFSLGLEYQNYTYFGENKNNNDAQGMALNTRFPLSFLPVLQPSMEAGFIYCDRLDPVRPDRLDNRQFYALLGISYTNRFLKNFEYGLELAAGASYMTFPNLLEDGGLIGSINLAAEAGLYLSLAPSYNFMIAFHPNFKYFYAITPSINDYNGFVLGTGITFHYRFGEDPDLPRPALNSLAWGDITLPPVYANMQQYYTDHPLGKFILINPQNYPVSDVEVYFSQKTYMDSPRYCTTIDHLNPGQSREIDLYATFNNQIFDIEGSEPVNGEINVTYKALGRNGAQKKSITFELNDKTTMTWDDYNKLAALITPADGSLKNYSSYIERACETELSTYFNKNLQLAMQLYCALTELNVIYQPDPVLPYGVARAGMDNVKDKVYLARDTLQRGSGDCDDLTVLFCSLLESIGIESGYMIMDDHIFPVFNTKEKARAYADLNPSREMTIPYNDELWVPVEMTLLGQTNFYEAWEKGIANYKANRSNERFFITRKAQEVYQPVGLKEKDLGLQYGDIKAIKKAFKTDLNQIINFVVTGYERKIREKEDKTVFNALGSLYGAAGQTDKAEAAFKKALMMDENYIFAKINLGILFIYKKNYQQALTWLTASLDQANAASHVPGNVMSTIYLNMSGCYKALGEEEKANTYQQLADGLAGKLVAAGHKKNDKTLNKEYSYQLGYIRD